MVIVAQLVRASDCGSEGRRFEPGQSPKIPKRCFGIFLSTISAVPVTFGQTLC
jgi:hypothetical protein